MGFIILSLKDNMSEHKEAMSKHLPTDNHWCTYLFSYQVLEKINSHAYHIQINEFVLCCKWKALELELVNTWMEVKFPKKK